MLEGGVDDHDDAGAGVLRRVGAHRLVELLQAWEGSSFGGEIGPVHHDVMLSQWHVARDRPAPVGAGRRSRWPGWRIRGGSRGAAAGGREGRREGGRARTTRLPCSRAPPGARRPRWPRCTARRRREQFDGPRVDLLHPDQGDPAASSARAPSALLGLVADLPAAQHDATHRRGILNGAVVDHVGGRSPTRGRRRSSAGVGAQHRFRRDDDERAAAGATTPGSGAGGSTAPRWRGW